MAQIQKLIQENQKLKYQLEKFKSSNGLLPYIDDSAIKGGYHVVKNISERDSIDCCHRKLGMKVLVIGNDLSFKEYILKTNNCKKNIWEEVDVTVEENDVFLTEDYSELSENLTTQKELNLILKQLILNLQTQIDNIELTDEKVQITEDTAFAQIGQSQKDFNKNVSDYKTNSDLKNQEQDDRLTNIEGENVAQYDLINDLNSELESERTRNDIQDNLLENLEGIHYTWSPTNRTLTLFDKGGNQLSQVSLVSLDNEGTDIRYNASTLSLELYNADNQLLDSISVSSFIGSVGTQLQLNSNQLQLKDSQGNILSTVSFSIVNIPGLQTALDSKLNKGSFPGNASDLKTEIDGKLNKPTTTGNTTTHPFVVGENGNGGSARLPAGDLGKNFFNADLSNITARNHTMNAGVTINTLGNPYSLTGLPNKEADPSFNKAIRINSSGQLGFGDTQQFNITVPDVITSNNNLSIAPLTVNHIYPNPVPNITTYVQDLQNIMATIGNLNFIKMSNWVVNTNNPTNSSQLIAGDGLVSFNLGYSQSAYDGFPVASVASQANLFPVNKNFVIFFNISATVFNLRWGLVLAGMSQSDDNTSIIVPTLAYASSNSSNLFGWSSGSQENILSNGQNGSVFIVKSGQVIFVVICNNSTGQKVVASFDANVNGGDYRFVATMIQKDVGSSQPLPLTEIKYWIEP